MRRIGQRAAAGPVVFAARLGPRVLCAGGGTLEHPREHLMIHGVPLRVMDASGQVHVESLDAQRPDIDVALALGAPDLAEPTIESPSEGEPARGGPGGAASDGPR